jgi:protein involved in polysaccharide export with SLBB domain
MVTARLLKSKGFTDPNLVKVTVLLRQSNAAQVHVVGEVGQQRNVPFSDRMGVVQAINLAGGVQWRTAKLESVRVVRGSLDHPTLIDLDLEDVYAGGERDVFLKPGDIVVVPPKYITMMDRYIQQLLSPISSLMGSTRQAAATAAGGL